MIGSSITPDNYCSVNASIGVTLVFITASIEHDFLRIRSLVPTC
jgi:hypothetical protein